MNTYSRRRRTFLSLVLSVAMVLSYSTAFLGTSAENVYADTSLITVDTWNADEEGVLHFELEEGYVQEDSWLRVNYDVNADMDPSGNYVKFELKQPDNFGCEFYSYPDTALEMGGRDGVTIMPPADLEIGSYNLTLNVYEDATGQNTFESVPTASYDIVIDVVPQKHYWFGVDDTNVYIYMLEGLEPEASAGELSVYIANYDDEFTGDNISQHVRFEFVGEDAESFYVDGLDDIAFAGPEDEMVQGKVYVRPVDGLAAGMYSAELNIYVDNTGEETVESTIPVELTISDREDYGFEMSVDNYGYFNALSKNYTSDDLINNTATVTIRNTGKNPFTVDPSQIGVFASYEGEGSIESGDFTVEPLFTAPRELAVGESIDVATVAPAMGLEVGLYNADLEYSIENDNGGSVGRVLPLEFRVVNDTASLVYQNESLDLGAYRPGSLEGAYTDLHVDLMNDGNVPLIITNVTEPENGPFAGLTEDDYQTWPIQSTEYGWICVSLDPESPYAEQLGTYEGNYVVTAKECDDEGNIVEGGSTVTVKVPVKVEITNTPPASFETNVMSGPHSEPLSIYTKTGYDSSEATTSFSIVGGYGEHFYGREIGDFVKFGLDETSADLITIEGFDAKEPLPELGKDEVCYKEVELALVEGLEFGCYEANVYMYVDPKGTGTFDEDNPTEVIPVNIQVEEGDAFDILPGEGDEFRFVLEQGYSEEDAAASAQSVVVRNRSNYDLVIESPADLDFWTEEETEIFELSYYEEEFPIEIAPGESREIATITPFTGLQSGEHKAWLGITAGEDYSSTTVSLVVLKGEPSIKWEDESLDFGYLRPGFDQDEAPEMTASGLNDGNTLLRINDVVIPDDSPFTVELGSGGLVVASGEMFSFQITPAAYKDSARKVGVYDVVATVYAQEIDEHYETFEGGKTVQAELPLHLEITDETYSITVDMQGHGENQTIAGILKGTEIARAIYGEHEENWPTAEGFQFFGYGVNPLSSYKSWDEYANDEENDLYRPISEDMTVYAGWLTEYKGAINLTINAPVCGRNANKVTPQITVPSGAPYGAVEPWWCTDENNWDDYTGKFVGGEEYYVNAEIRPAYMYAFPDGELTVNINGKPYNHIGQGRGIAGSFILSPAVPVTAVHDWGSWTVTKAATTSAAGVETRTCAGCGKTETRAIPKKQETKYSNGWHKIGGNWYYYKNNAPVKNGWMKDSKGWCYLGADGKMVANGWAKDSKGWVWMNGSGYWDTRTRWIKYDGGWYHTTKGYRDQNKWRKDSKGWCYLGSNGRMVTNGWAKDSVGWCWMGSNGYWTSNKWVKDNGEWYYIKSNHYMASNEWAKDSGGWMFMAKNGKITKSKWIKSGGAWYYLKDNGYMATGTLKIGSKTYRFASSGKWID